MKKYAVIVAGGSGIRMGGPVPKQFLLLKGKPVLHYTLQTFLNAFADLQVILVVPQNALQQGEALVRELEAADRIRLAAGGETRFNSVKNGLALVSDPSIVFVHDGVRCLVSTTLIQKCYEQALSLGSAIPAITATDSIRVQYDDGNKSIDRDTVKIIQTPQTFRSELILTAFSQVYQPQFTDEAAVIESAGHRVHLIEGEHSNIKITRPLDLCVAEFLLSTNASTT